MAKFHFRYGAMNSGKSDTLIKTAYNYAETGLVIATIKPGIDTKGDNKIVARAGGEWPADILAGPDDDLTQKVSVHMAARALVHLDCILTDERQFFTADQIDQLFYIAKIRDVSVISFGLRTDFRRQLFPGSQRLLELADNIEKLPTMCRCGSQAEFNTRKLDDEYVFDGEQVAIDGEQSITYDSLCGVCYLTEQAKQQTLPHARMKVARS